MSLISRIKKPFQATARDDHFLILDIGNSSVKALIVRKTAAVKKGYVVGLGSEELNSHDVKKGQITNIHSVADKCNTAIERAVQLAGIRPVNAITSISSPRVISQINKLVYKRRKPELKLTNKELNHIVADINEQSKAKLLKSPDLVGSTGDYELINAAIQEIVVDGVKIDNPIDFIGADLEITMYQAYAPMMLINAVQSVADDLKLNLLATAYTAYALAKTFPASDYRYQNAFIIDIGDQITDVALNQNGVLVGTTSFDFGIQKFSSQLAKELDVSLEKASQYTIDYSENLLSQDTESAIKELFKPISESWHKQLLMAIEKVDCQFPPAKIFLTGGGAKLPEIAAVLSASQVKLIHPIDVENVIDKTTYLGSTQDISPLCLAELALNYQDSSSKSEQLFRRLFQTLRT